MKFQWQTLILQKVTPLKWVLELVGRHLVPTNSMRPVALWSTCILSLLNPFAHSLHGYLPSMRLTA